MTAFFTKICIFYTSSFNAVSRNSFSVFLVPSVPSQEISPIANVEDNEEEWREKKKEPVDSCILVEVVVGNSFYRHGPGIFYFV